MLILTENGELEAKKAGELIKKNNIRLIFIIHLFN